MNHQKQSHPDATTSSSHDPSLFSVEEFDSFYLLSIDLPGFSEDATQVMRSRTEVSVRSRQGEIFHLKAQNAGGPRVSYEDGSLWLMLPKNSAKKGSVQSQ